LAVQGQLDRTYLDVDLGVDVLFAGGLTLHAGYSGRVSDHVRSNAGAFGVQAAMASTGADGRLSNGPGSDEAMVTLSMPLR
jgi:hypothetical protein